MQHWKLQEAKAKFSEVIKEAMKEGPQLITLRGEPAAVIISKEMYDTLTHSPLSFLDFMRNSPLAKVQLNIQRDPSLTRDIEL